MDGYEVVTYDGDIVGHVVGTERGNLIVEQGKLRHSRHALPAVFTEVDEDESVVRTTLSKRLISESPKVADDGDVDEHEIAAYYGLGTDDGTPAPPTLGEGVLDADDPTVTAEQQGRQAGVSPPEQEGAEMRERLAEQPAEFDAPPRVPRFPGPGRPAG